MLAFQVTAGNANANANDGAANLLPGSPLSHSTPALDMACQMSVGTAPPSWLG